MWFLHGISSIISVFLFHVIRYRRKVVHENIKSSFPELSPRKRWMIERRFYTHFCDLIMESVKYFSISKGNIKRRMRFKGIERVEESVRKGRSCGVLLGHYGNWEWVSSMPLWIDPKLCLCTQLYHPLENYVTDQLILYTRRRFGGVNIQMDKSIKYMVNYRNEGKPILVGFISDQAPFWDNIYYWSDFLHHETPWFTGGERIMQKLDMDVYYLDVRRVKRGYYTAEYKLITTEPESKEQFWITDQYAQMLEATIKRGPSYWLWSHRRWKRTKEEWLRITHGGIKPKS
jgi:KDO2-lipid IV(A) lauroyltransferase